MSPSGRCGQQRHSPAPAAPQVAWKATEPAPWPGWFRASRVARSDRPTFSGSHDDGSMSGRGHATARALLAKGLDESSKFCSGH